jgi:hypothetical protein
MSRRILIRSILIVVAATVLTASLATAAGPLQFYSVTPCRVVDTRNATGITGGPALAAFQVRNFPMRGHCGIDTLAVAVSLNVTVVTPASSGYLTLWPSGTSQPVVSTINFSPADVALANGAIVPLAPGAMSNTEIAVFNGSPGATHLLLDVTGYFAP